MPFWPGTRGSARRFAEEPACQRLVIWVELSGEAQWEPWGEFLERYEVVARSGHPSGREWDRSGPIEVCDRDSLAGHFSTTGAGVIVVVGNEGLMQERRPDGVRVLVREVRAENLVMGQELLREVLGDGSPETVRPIYVRAPDADMHITKMKDPWAENAGREPQKEGR